MIELSYRVPLQRGIKLEVVIYEKMIKVPPKCGLTACNMPFAIANFVI